jgi:site-specific recombinase XerD
LPDLRQP